MKACKKAGLIFLLTLLLSASGRILSGGQEIPIYRTLENKARIDAMYAENLAKWPLAYESVFVPTRYGKTHLIASGKKRGPAIVMFHAMGTNATMWLPNIVALARRHRVYCLDTIGDLGRSELKDPALFPQNGRECSLWLRDVFDRLGIQSAALIGSSQGGWIALNLALHEPERVSKIVLLGPMGIPEDALPRILKRLSSFLLSPTAANKESMIQWTIGDHPRALAAFAPYMRTALDCRGRVPLPLPLSDQQLQGIKAPVLLFLGGKDGPIGDPQKAAARARAFIPDIRVEIIPQAGHLISIEEPGLVNRRILEFLETGK